jgi:hypothetical protein
LSPKESAEKEIEEIEKILPEIREKVCKVVLFDMFDKTFVA